jgi:transcriptional regulator with PAS, ATPase and Fis domain
MLALYHLIDRVGASQIPVLIFGESGTGKELVARALHRVSPRHDKPFVSENCGAIPEPLLESILFGHKRGAFTGAVQNHVGLFETANGGTLFLDELGEMSLPMQAKLLRVLESGELRRVGDDRVLKVDVRVFGASHRNLEQMVSEGRFREDLYYRLNVITVRLPPLRERATDIPDLVRHFLRVARKGRPLAIEPDAMAALQAFGWPGNVRQLENELRRASVLADNCIGSEHLSPVVTAAVTVNPASLTHLSLHEHVAKLETQLIERALREASGNQSRAAEALGVSRFGLQKMLKRLGLSLPK